MREIKFRAWNAYANQMYEVDLLHIRNTRPQIPTTLEGNYMSLVYQPKVVLMQYTGLRDRTKWEQLSANEKRDWLDSGKRESEWNGREIYEGDIVNGGEQIVFSDGMFCLSYGGETGESLAWVHANDPDLEVIGNIYENPELLEAAS